MRTYFTALSNKDIDTMWKCIFNPWANQVDDEKESDFREWFTQQFKYGNSKYELVAIEYIKPVPADMHSEYRDWSNCHEVNVVFKVGSHEKEEELIFKAMPDGTVRIDAGKYI